jgi:cytochrome bd-type quinol oxidase subunit 2
VGLERWLRLLPGLWAGLLLTVALVATPAAFALLPQAEAGRVAARVLAQEAHVSLALGAVLLALERLAARRRAHAGQGSQFSSGMVLAAVALFCTVAGYFAVQPFMEAARAGQGGLSFGQLHGISAGFYGLKLVCVLALAWRAAASGPG